MAMDKAANEAYAKGDAKYFEGDPQRQVRHARCTGMRMDRKAARSR